MKNWKWAVLSLCFFTTISLHAQAPDTSWANIDTLIVKDLPASARKLAETRLKDAKARKDEVNQIKATQYILYLHKKVAEEGVQGNIIWLHGELKNTSFPLRNWLLWLLADQYIDYAGNKYDIQYRSEVKGSLPDTALDVWGPQQFLHRIDSLYSEMLKDSMRLQKIPSGKYAALSSLPVQKGPDLSPTLFDVLAVKALNFYQQMPYSIREEDEIHLKDLSLLSSFPVFVQINISELNGLSAADKKAIKLYQQLIRLHIQRKEDIALAAIDLKRISYIYGQLQAQEAREAADQAMLQLEKLLTDKEAKAMTAFTRAKFIFDHAFLPVADSSYKSYKFLAIATCNNTVKNYPGTLGANNCLHLIEEITTPSMDIEDLAFLQMPDKPQLLSISYKDVSAAYFKVIKVNDQLLPLWNSLMTYEDVYRIKPDSVINSLAALKAMQEQKLNFPHGTDHEEHEYTARLAPLPIGRYFLIYSTDSNYRPDSSISFLQPLIYSSLRLIEEKNYQANYDQWYVRDAETGKGLKNVKVQARWKPLRNGQNKASRIDELTTGKEGGFQLQIPESTDGSNAYLSLKKGADSITYKEYMYNTPRSEKSGSQQTFFFTDRSIYRPGQTVHYKGIMVHKDKEGKHSLIKGQKSTVHFYDTQDNLLSSQEVATNDFGSFSGSFYIPASLLNGGLSIKDDHGSTYFNVEEYKRPKFEVSFDPVTTIYRLNDEIKVKGQVISYSGASIAHASVQLSISRSAIIPYYDHYRYTGHREKQILDTTIRTDANGNFELNFKAEADTFKDPEGYAPDKYSFTIRASATDISGETQEGSTTIWAAKVSMSLWIDIESTWNKRKSQDLEAKAQNLNGQEINTKVKLKIEKLKTPDKPVFYDKFKGKENFKVQDHLKQAPYISFPGRPEEDELPVEKRYIEKELQSNTRINLSGSELKDLPQGLYRITVTSTDTFGQEVSNTGYVTLFDPKSKRPARKDEVLNIYNAGNTYAKAGEKVQFLIASPVKAYTKVLASSNGIIIYNKWIKLNGRQKLIEIDIPAQAKNAISVQAYTMVQDRLVREGLTIPVYEEKASLQIKTVVFRSKLRPGQEESWRFHIQTPDGKTPQAEMLAGMYDASLDKFRSHYWELNFENYVDNTFNITQPDVLRRLPLASYNINRRLIYHQWQDRNFNLYNFSWQGSDNTYLGEIEHRYLNYGKAGSYELNSSTVREYSVADNTADPHVPTENKPSDPPSTPIQIRKNLQETAFFYPHLLTNDKGDVIVEFRIPESLTRWNFMALAHTRDLAIGTYRQTLITQKELMVQPNAPRFLRVGDSAMFSVRVSNMQPQAKDGYAELRILDPVTEKDITTNYLYDAQSSGQHYKIAANGSEALRWALKIPESSTGFIYRITAEAGDFSDGEESLVPVLPKKIMITESRAISLRAGEKKTYSLQTLTNAKEKGIQPQLLKLETTSNPAWYAVQALPYLMEYPYACAEQVFNRYYANSVGKYLIDQNTTIQKVLAAWRSSGNKSLGSMLNKNPELKSLLIEETPWLRDAQSEAEQQHRIALLFEDNNIQKELQDNLLQLEGMQLGNGAWPWFNNMQGDRYITQYIVAGLGKLEVMNMRNEYLSRNRQMVIKAIDYMDKLMVADYNRRDTNRADNLTPINISYLYSRGYYDVPVNREYDKAIHYWINQGMKYYAKRSLMEKAMLAVALKKWGEEAASEAILNSIDEYALHSDEMGMYWKEYNQKGCYWYQRPIETQAILIEAYKYIRRSNKAVEEMKIWLLKQKQVQKWESTKATAEACYALLMSGRSISAESQKLKINLGNHLIEPDAYVKAADAGTGYFSHTWTGNDIKPEMGKIEVDNQNINIAWGALHLQYLQDIDKVEATSGALQLSKEIYINNGQELVKLNANTQLKPGDRLTIRLILRSDRQMEYIHIKDQRAAALEPVDVLSGYSYNGTLGYYKEIKDASVNFFIDHLSKGTHIITYELLVNQAGAFNNGVAEVQSMYAPEFNSHTGSVKLIIKP